MPLWVAKQAISHPMATVVGYGVVTGIAIGNPVTRRVGFQMGSYGLRAGGNIMFGAARGLLTTPFVRGGSFTLGRASGSIAAGYVLGAVVGTGISYALWGEDGASDAIDVYTGQVSFGQYVDTVYTGLKTLF